MQYKPYNKKSDTPRRMSRKQERNRIFVANKKLARQLRKKLKLERLEAMEAEV